MDVSFECSSCNIFDWKMEGVLLEVTLLEVAWGCKWMGREWGMTCTEATTGGSL